MAILGVVNITRVVTSLTDPSTNPGNFCVQASVAGLDASNPVELTTQISNVAPSVLNTGIATPLLAQAKTDLIAHGYSFGIFDSVQLLP